MVVGTGKKKVKKKGVSDSWQHEEWLTIRRVYIVNILFIVSYWVF